ncbi:MAG: transcription antitermination factor NusB [Sporomusaceae bacterium]|nr:transcription antitermination factor NusB [Sporomusaceae bacterium]
MSRRIARELALQALFHLDFNKSTVDAALDSVCEEREELSKSARDYAKLLLIGTSERQDEIDQIITAISKEWKVERMAGIDRNIVRMAIYELQFAKEKLSAGVIINEAIELAKCYGTDQSGRFVNGILGSLVKEQQS